MRVILQAALRLPVSASEAALVRGASDRQDSTGGARSRDGAPVRSPWMEIRPITVSMSVRPSVGGFRDQDRQRHGTRVDVEHTRSLRV